MLIFVVVLIDLTDFVYFAIVFVVASESISNVTPRIWHSFLISGASGNKKETS